MKKDIHPEYYPEATVTCACGNSWTTGSTQAELRVDICSNCHPFYTGEQRIVDSEGQVDRFYKRLEARQKYVQDVEAREAERVSPDRLISELEVSKRVVDKLAAVGINNAGEFIEKLGEGEDKLLEIDGFGRKSLADVKKSLRRLGYDLPEQEPA
ncbi:MAG: 50S ribosomal protein L31 [Anaerolineales bacterium]|nr:50S ribosomal protein L31 [Anaerolineales bacterium]